jgi:hypothetical protein
MMEAMFELPGDESRRKFRVTLPFAKKQLENSDFALVRNSLKAS